MVRRSVAWAARWASVSLPRLTSASSFASAATCSEAMSTSTAPALGVRFHARRASGGQDRAQLLQQEAASGRAFGETTPDPMPSRHGIADRTDRSGSRDEAGHRATQSPGPTLPTRGFTQAGAFRTKPQRRVRPGRSVAAGPNMSDRRAPHRKTGRTMARSARKSPDADSLTVEHEGRLWKPLPGATVTFEACIQARARFVEVHEHVSWNPWDQHLLEEAEQTCFAVDGQWTRAEPGFRQLTSAEAQACMAQWDADFEAEQQRKSAAR